MRGEVSCVELGHLDSAQSSLYGTDHRHSVVVEFVGAAILNISVLKSSDLRTIVPPQQS
jgi:hypothetical protein